MDNSRSNLDTIIRSIQQRIRALELAAFTYGQQPETPPSNLLVNPINHTINYYVEPVTNIPRASVTWTWSAPVVSSERYSWAGTTNNSNSIREIDGVIDSINLFRSPVFTSTPFGFGSNNVTLGALNEFTDGRAITVNTAITSSTYIIYVYSSHYIAIDQDKPYSLHMGFENVGAVNFPVSLVIETYGTVMYNRTTVQKVLAPGEVWDGFVNGILETGRTGDVSLRINLLYTATDVANGFVPPVGAKLKLVNGLSVVQSGTATGLFHGSMPEVNNGDPVVDYLTSITRSTDGATGEYKTTNGSTTLTTAGLALNTSVTLRLRAVTEHGVQGAVNSKTVAITINSTPPNQPATPTVTSEVKGVRVSNNGLDTSGNGYSGLQHFELHVSYNTNNNFTPTNATLYSLVGPNTSVFVPANDLYQPVYARLIAVNTSGIKSAASAGSNATPKKIVTTDINGIVLPGSAAFSEVNNLLPDGSFENADYRAARLALQTPSNFTFVDDSALANHGRWYLRIDGASGQNVKQLLPYQTNNDVTSQFSRIAVPPETKLFIAVKVRNLAADGGISFRLYFHDANNVVINAGGAGTYTAITPALYNTGDWEDYFYTVVTPPLTASIFIAIISESNHTTGQWLLDSIQIQKIIGTQLIEDAAITRAKIGDAAIGTAQIEEVDAGLVKSGFIHGDRIQAESITTPKIAIGAVSLGALAPGLGNTLPISGNPALGDMASATQLNNLSNNVNSIDAAVNTLTNTVVIDGNGVAISKQGSPFQVVIDNDSLDFLDGGSVVAYVSGQRMYISAAEILNQLTVGVHTIEKYDANNTLIRWTG